MGYNLDVILNNLPESIIDKLEYLEDTGVIQYYIANLILSNEYKEKDKSPREVSSRAKLEKRVTKERENRYEDTEILTEKREVKITQEVDEIVEVEIDELIEEEEETHEYDAASLEFLKNMTGI